MCWYNGICVTHQTASYHNFLTVQATVTITSVMGWLINLFVWLIIAKHTATMVHVRFVWSLSMLSTVFVCIKVHVWTTIQRQVNAEAVETHTQSFLALAFLRTAHPTILQTWAHASSVREDLNSQLARPVNSSTAQSRIKITHALNASQATTSTSSPTYATCTIVPHSITWQTNVNNASLNTS